MSGRGRQFYHGTFISRLPAIPLIQLSGIPRILEGTIPNHFLTSTADSIRLSATKQWLTNGRININARQVFPPGFARPASGTRG